MRQFTPARNSGNSRCLCTALHPAGDCYPKKAHTNFDYIESHMFLSGCRQRWLGHSDVVLAGNDGWNNRRDREKTTKWSLMWVASAEWRVRGCRFSSRHGNEYGRIAAASLLPLFN